MKKAASGGRPILSSHHKPVSLPAPICIPFRSNDVSQPVAAFCILLAQQHGVSAGGRWM